jgi:hypothetical protein
MARDGFSKTQWSKQEAGTCIPCCDDHGKREKEKRIEKHSGKKADNGEGEVNQSAPKKTGKFVVSKTAKKKLLTLLLKQKNDNE